MARKPKSSQVLDDDRSKLLDALKFVSFIFQGAEISDYQFVRISNGLITAADNTVCMGAPVESDLDICLQGEKLQAALTQCGSNFQFTQIDTSSVSIRSEKFRAIVPCFASDMIFPTSPDKPIADLTNNLLEAIDACNDAVSGKGTKPHDHGLRIGSNSIVATNGHLLIEAWHGLDLPDGLIIPKRALQALIKSKKSLGKFGFSNTSATFYFDDNTFIKTRLIDGLFPNYNKIFDQFVGVGYQDLPADFYAALDAIKNFVVEDRIYFHDACISTDRSLDAGASYKVEHLPGGSAYSPKLWGLVRGKIKGVYFGQYGVGAMPYASIFYGDAIRGVIAGKNAA